MYVTVIAVIFFIAVLIFFLTTREKYEKPPPTQDKDDVLEHELSVCGNDQQCIIQVVKQANVRKFAKKNV